MDWADGTGAGRASGGLRGAGADWIALRTGTMRIAWKAAALAGVLLIGAGVGWVARGPHRLAAVVAPYPHDLAEVKFAVAGDVIPHEAVRAAAKNAAEAKGAD